MASQRSYEDKKAAYESKGTEYKYVQVKGRDNRLSFLVEAAPQKSKDMHLESIHEIEDSVNASKR